MFELFPNNSKSFSTVSNNEYNSGTTGQLIIVHSNGQLKFWRKSKRSEQLTRFLKKSSQYFESVVDIFDNEDAFEKKDFKLKKKKKSN